MVGESPRWLAQKGRQREAADALQRAAIRNRVAITPELIAALDNLRNEGTICIPVHLFVYN